MSAFITLYLIPALALGAIYAMGAVGISMIFGILRFSHFAHGDVMTHGAFDGQHSSPDEEYGHWFQTEKWGEDQ